MKKLFSILISVTLLLCACAQGGSGEVSGSRKKEGLTQSGQKVESSIFGRNVKYDAFTPAEGLALPIPSDEIIDMAQIEKALYFLTYGAVYTLNIETGASEKLFDTDAAMFAYHGGMLYTYSAETFKLSEYDLSGGVTNETAIEITDVDSVLSFLVVDDYYVFYCYIPGTIMMEPHLFVYSRETEEFILSKKLMATRIYPYKGNKVLTVTEDSVFSAIYLNAFDAESGKNERLATIGGTERVGQRPGVAYCPKTDTVLVYGCNATPNSDVPCCITEFSLTDTDSIVHNRYYLDVNYETKFFLGVYENIVSAVTTIDSEYRIYDYLNPPESITILGYLNNQDLIRGFEKESGILVRIASTDSDKLTLKLMAGDDDFDIFNTGSGFHHYVDSGAYVNLKEIESLNSRISGNAAADLVVSYDGRYFGVPAGVLNWCTEENYPEDGSGRSYSLVISELIYFTRNVDVAEGRYSDPNGDELYKLFKFINDNPTGNRKKMPFGGEVTFLGSNVYMLNPKSQHYDSAVMFLEYLFDCYNGDIPGVIPEEDIYPRLESTDNCYAEWRCYPVDIISPIFEARNEVLNPNADFSNSELKKLARETAAEVRMRMME